MAEIEAGTTVHQVWYVEFVYRLFEKTRTDIPTLLGRRFDFRSLATYNDPGGQDKVSFLISGA